MKDIKLKQYVRPAFLEEKEDKAQSSIKELIKTDWGKNNDSQGKASEIFKGLSFSDDPLANKFMDKINKFTSSLNADDF